MALKAPETPDRPASPAKRNIKRNDVRQKAQGSLTHETELTSLEEAWKAALEVAQEEDEKAKESSEDA
jgi:hypothetical protein